MFVSVLDLVSRWGVSKAWVYQQAKRDPHFPRLRKFGGTTRISIAEVEAYERTR
jgi:predicted DNA-binding transcriptional regulator AlpA